MAEWTADGPTKPGAYWIYNTLTKTVSPALVAYAPPSKSLWMHCADNKGPWVAITGPRKGILFLGPLDPPEPPDA